MALTTSTLLGAVPVPTLTGAVPPPPGITPDFDSPEDAGHRANLVITILGNSFLCVFFFIRCYAKFSLSPRILLEDCKWESRLLSLGHRVDGG